MTMNYAQTMTYNLTNSSMTKWDFRMENIGSVEVIYEMGISPGESRTGEVSDFKLPMEIKVENLEGCGASQIMRRPTPIMNWSIACEANADIKFQVKEVIPFIAWHLDLQFQ